jgi:Flp pilus assembly pilin Flp
MTFINHLIARLHTREEGQTMAEYAVVLTVIAAFILVALGVLATGIDERLRDVASVITG